MEETARRISVSLVSSLLNHPLIPPVETHASIRQRESLRQEPNFVRRLGLLCSLVAPVNSAVAMKNGRPPPNPPTLVERSAAILWRACVSFRR